LSQQLGDDKAIFVAMAATDLAEIALAEGDFDTALHWLEQSFPYASQHPRRFVVLLSALAGYLVLSHKGNIQKAAQFFGAIESLSERSGVILGGFYQDLNHKRMELARKELSAKEWQREFETGRGLERSEAVQQAKDLLALIGK
jgi:ATP/maltotriose-dependent transcriptional regulator MalT